MISFNKVRRKRRKRRKRKRKRRKEEEEERRKRRKRRVTLEKIKTFVFLIKTRLILLSFCIKQVA